MGHTVIQSLNKYLSAYYVPGAIPSVRQGVLRG